MRVHTDAPTHSESLMIPSFLSLLFSSCFYLFFLTPVRDRDAKVDRRTVFCMSGYEIGVGLYVLMEAHFHHQIGVKGMYGCMYISIDVRIQVRMYTRMDGCMHA